MNKKTGNEFSKIQRSFIKVFEKFLQKVGYLFKGDNYLKNVDCEDNVIYCISDDKYEATVYIVGDNALFYSWNCYILDKDADVSINIKKIKDNEYEFGVSNTVFDKITVTEPTGFAAKFPLATIVGSPAIKAINKFVDNIKDSENQLLINRSKDVLNRLSKAYSNKK